MPAPWIVDDAVDVKLGTLWCPGIVKVVLANGRYKVDLDDPLPTLADCGKTHPYVPGSTPHDRSVTVNASGNLFDSPTDLSTIRDSV